VLDDRGRGQREESERALLGDPELQRRLRAPGARLRHRFETPALVVLVAFLAFAAFGLLVLGLPLQSMVVVAVGVWPWSVLRRRWRARPRPQVGD